MSETETQLVTRPAFGLQSFTALDVIARVRLIHEVMAAVMKEGVHYGKVPGCGDKPSLLKPGAEVLCNTFMFAAEYEKVTKDMGNGHFLYDIQCKLTHIPTGLFVGSCLAVATTLEGKWRYRSEIIRGEDGDPVGVPQAYWKTHNPELIGGSEFQTKKIDGRWVVVHKVEHDNPADYYNTATKIGCKRALVGATMNVTGVSDVFTQDVEDMPEVFSEAPAQQSTRISPKAHLPRPSPRIQGVVKSWSHQDKADPKKTWYIGELNGRNLWTSKTNPGEQLLEANGLEVVLTIKPGTKPNSYQVLAVDIPDKPETIKTHERT